LLLLLHCRIIHPDVVIGFGVTAFSGAIMHKPFAVEIYDRFLKGDSIRELADDLRIPEDRIEQRLRAAALYLRYRPEGEAIDGQTDPYGQKN
jgi:hypothetical protein